MPVAFSMTRKPIAASATTEPWARPAPASATKAVPSSTNAQMHQTMNTAAVTPQPIC